MRFHSLWFSLLVMACGHVSTLILTSNSYASDKGTFFLKQFCIDCHSADDAAGERDFSSLDLEQYNLQTQIRLQEVIDQLTLGTMPPEDAEQPPKQQRLEVIGELTEILMQMRARSQSTGGKTVLRRLTRREYRNTISDLLGIDMVMFDPTTEFPEDILDGGFDNVGHALITSGFLLDQYLQAADDSVEKAFEQLKPNFPKSWVFKDYFYQQTELRIAHDKAFKHRYLCLYDHRNNDKPQGAYGPLHELTNGVPFDGVYEVKVYAQALHRNTPYSHEAIQIDNAEPFRMGIRPGLVGLGDMAHTQPIEPLLAETPIFDDELRWYTFNIPLDQGHSPRFTFENGAHNTRGAFARVFRYHRELIPEDVRDSKSIVSQRNWVLKDGLIPQIRIHKVFLRGPLPNPDLTSRQNQLLGGTEFNSHKTRALVTDFTSRAFRRPVQEDEIDSFMRIYDLRVEDGHLPLEAYKDTLKAVLCSPSFLYFSPSPETEGVSRQHALAERLAYFLTSSMPDSHLRELAEKQQLDSQTLRLEALRLLASSESDRFIADFIDNWLGLRALGRMPPDPDSFRVYYASALEEEMKRETQLFMRDLIDRNASALRFLNARYTFANRDLAKLYGVENQVPVGKAEEFHRVEFDSLSRGGLLGHASVLTVSANGVDTSPVTRGVWISKNIMGIQPPLPPDNVPAIDPDVRGAKTIRQQLAKHRESATCNQCHRNIDPYGFALENFDPIGRFRTHYDSSNKLPVDASGRLPGGRMFSGPAQLKSILVENKDFFIRTLTKSLLVHALGRPIEPTDRGEVEEITLAVEGHEYALRDLILAVVTSDLFSR